MSESDILKLAGLSGGVLAAVVAIFIAGGLLAVIVAATLADAILRQVEARRIIVARQDRREKL